MKDQETLQRFIQLRARGQSFARIAQELDVSRGTLINWSRKCQCEIQNQRAIELEALREELLASREARARALADQLHQVEAELQKRNMADLFRYKNGTILVQNLRSSPAGLRQGAVSGRILPAPP